MLTPADESELADAVAAARGPLRVQGGGTRGIGAGVAGEILSLAGLAGITLYEPGALTLRARAGTPLARIEAALAAEGQRLPFEPGAMGPVLGREGESTIGGVVASNASGPRRIVAGACRDSLIGLRFVDGAGTVIESGGRVMKNVTGYDLVKLLAGSRGTLGVLSEVTFKVLPGAAACATLVIEGLDPGRAVATMAAALGTPYEVSGAAHLPDDVTMLRLEGSEASVAYRAERLQAALARFGEARIETGGARWSALRDMAMFAGGAGDLWRISVKPSAGAEVAKRLDGARLAMDWGGGMIWAEQDPGTDLRPRLDGLGGHATLIRAAPETHAALGTFHPEPPPLAAISEGLRRKFDPRGILNPGLMTTRAA